MRNLLLFLTFALITSQSFANGQNLLFVGSLNGDNILYQIDQNNGNAVSQIATGLDISGMAVDLQNELLYFTISANQLYSLPVSGGTPTLIGSISTGPVVGLGFYNGTLYGSGQFNGTNTALVTIDVTTAATTLLAFMPGVSSPIIQGLTADPNTGILYGTDDGATSIIQINLDGTTSVVAAYPAGFNDMDGLAMDEQGNLYLVPDDSDGAEDIQVYNINTNSYGTPISNPISGTATVAGGAAFFCTPTTIPTLSEWGLIIFGLLVVATGLVVVRQRKMAFS